MEEKDALSDYCEGKSYNELVEVMLKLQQTHDDYKAKASEAWDNLCLVTRRIIPNRMDKDQIQNITVILPDGSKKQLLCIDQVSVKTPPERKGDLWAWLIDNGAEDLISQTVNASTLGAFIREQMRQGAPYPNDICEVSTYVTASLRKA